MYVLVVELFFVHHLGFVVALVFPGGDKHEVIIVALRLAVFGLMLHAEVTATALFSLVGVGNVAGELEA